MDPVEETPTSPAPDHDWNDNAGAETPDHVSENEHESEFEPADFATNSGTHEHAKERPRDSKHSNAEESDDSLRNDDRLSNGKDSRNRSRVVTAESSNESDDESVLLKRKSKAHIDDSSDENEEEEPSKKKRKTVDVMDDLSDVEDNNEFAEKQDATMDKSDEQVAKIMDDIFGEDSGSEIDDQTEEHQRKQKFGAGDDEEGEVRVVRKSSYSGEEEERPRHRWDFDEMMAQKKAERKKTRRRRGRDGGIDLISDNDEQIKTLVDQMTRAAALDRVSNENRQPAYQKHKLLPIVRQTLLKQDLFEALLDNGMMSAVSDWLAPLPDKSLPSLEIRTTLLKILSDFPNLEQGVLRQSGLGKAVMYLLKHPREVKENKQRAARLIREWSRPIFQLESDYTSMTREERFELDYTLQSRKKRFGDDSQPSSSNQGIQRQNSNEEASNPGQAGFVSRARVPKPSTKAYLHRPKSVVEGQFHGPSKTRATSRFDVAQREFKERTKKRNARRHVAVSIAGNNMGI